MIKRAFLIFLLITIAFLPDLVRGQDQVAPAEASTAALVAPPPVAPAPPAAPALETLSGRGVITASGAVQFLYQWRQDDAGTEPVDRFLTRRVELALYGNPTERTRYGIIIDLTDGDLIEGAAEGFEARLREAWIGFDLHPNFSADVGSFRPPWTLTMDGRASEEIFVRYPLLTAANPFTPWRQTGIMATGRGADLFTLSVGLFNGIDNPDNYAETNNMKDTMVSVKVEYFPGFRVYLGHWGGETEIGPEDASVTTDYTNTWLGTEIESGRFLLGAEAVWNRIRPETGNDLNSFGYQLSLAYAYREVQPVLRYEQFDPDNGTDNDEREWTTIGLNYMIAPTARLMADYIFKSERQDNQTANDEFLLQLSVWF